jgi:taurine dioxygenase
VGGDTLWASGEAAYDRLSEPLKRLVDPLRAVHAFTPLEASEWNKHEIPYHWTDHPVVRVHPESGRRSLFVSPRWTWEIVGLRPHESQALLLLLYDHILQHEHLGQSQHAALRRR